MITGQYSTAILVSTAVPRWGGQRAGWDMSKAACFSGPQYGCAGIWRCGRPHNHDPIAADAPLAPVPASSCVRHRRRSCASHFANMERLA
eukprot:350941-Chlamydomonas_euryale.AAC.8